MTTTPATSRWNHYYTPESVSDALALLRRYDGRARVIGGGTDLLVEIQRGLRQPPEAFVDTSRIAGLDRIVEEDGYIVVGCAVTHSRIVGDARIIRHGTCLAESCSVIGGPQVRNAGTLAGNVAQALPAGDGTIGLLACNGEVEVASGDGIRWMPLRETFVGPGRSAIDRHRELLTRLRFRAGTAREGSAHHRVMRPQGLCLPIVSVAARLRLDDGGTITGARIAMGPVGPVPFVAEAAMQTLIGGPASAGRFEDATQSVLDSVTLRASKYRATLRYRSQMIRTCLPAVLSRAAARAAGGDPGLRGAGP